MSDEAAAANVIEALTRVIRDLPGIAKGRSNEGGLKYAFRGIEQITAEVQPLLARHGVVFAPRLIDYRTEKVTVGGNPWTDTYAQVSYTVYGPGGIEDRIEVGPIPAIGRDNSDKGANKAMSQAFKYALLQTLMVADAKDDGDQHTHVADARRYSALPALGLATEDDDGVRASRPAPPPAPRPLDVAAFTKAATAAHATPDDVEAMVLEATGGISTNLEHVEPGQVQALRAAFKTWTERPMSDRPARPLDATVTDPSDPLSSNYEPPGPGEPGSGDQ